jgi:hypothetical protein
MDLTQVIIVDHDPDDGDWTIYRSASIFVNEKRVHSFISDIGYSISPSLAEALTIVMKEKAEGQFQDRPVMVLKVNLISDYYAEDEFMFVNDVQDAMMAILRFS